MKNNPDWSGDGTYKICPIIYHQLYTIHIQVGTLSIPRLFALLPGKGELVYDKLYEALKNLRVNLQPATIIMDFEKGAINSITNAFQGITVTLCLFHFFQSLYRKLVELGFINQYHNDGEFNLKIRCYSALAFLPVDHVVDAFIELSDDDDIPQEFVSYVFMIGLSSICQEPIIMQKLFMDALT